MKKIIYLLFSVLLFAGIINANPVTQETAQTIATNFYSQRFKSPTPILTLVHTEFANDGTPDYYIFNVNNNDGFVIIAGEDAAHPILGYSDKGKYVSHANVSWWMNCRKQEIECARIKNIPATSDITNEWTGYINNTVSKTHNAMSFVNPLLLSTWNQSPYYNATCPGGSVTGCVATAMAQIMRYWSYPSHGHGYSGYWERTGAGFTNNYGYLAANYDSSNYVWSAMPYSLSNYNDEVAKLMLDCGISVDMDYSPGGSGAWVVNGDYPVSAQNSYVKYFGYNAKTVQGVYEANYNYANWITLIENELNNNRPVQYVGNDSVNNAGHTWVCDGYDASNNFDMNWGWGGGSNGYFAPNALNVAGYSFNWWNEAVIGIEPPAVSAYFSGTPTFGCTNFSAKFSDTSISTSAITGYKWLFPGGSPATSTAASPTVMYSTPGTYDVTEIVNTSGGADTMVRKNYISVTALATTNTTQGFQSAIFPPSGWVINNPNNYSYTWQLNTGFLGGYGNSSQCMMFNNTQVIADFLTIYTQLWVTPPGKPGVDVIGQRQQIYSPEYNFTHVASPEIYFDVAYAPFNASLSDTLNIYYSTDCGATFHQIYSKGGMTLGTTGNMVSTGADTNSKGIFTPANNNWRTDTIHIPAIAGMPDILFSFENQSGNGAALYIDNISINGKSTLGISDISTTEPSAKVYPNPNNGQFNIELTNASGSPYVKIYNVLGEEIYTASLKNEDNQVNLSNQPKGIYIYRLLTETGSPISTGRLVVE